MTSFWGIRHDTSVNVMYAALEIVTIEHQDKARWYRSELAEQIPDIISATLSYCLRGTPGKQP